jgi:hypothetical protein
MKLHVFIGTEEAVEDWVEFRQYFEAAAEEMGLEITEIVHRRMEDKQ